MSHTFVHAIGVHRTAPNSPWGPGGLSRECVLRIPMRVVKGD